MHHYRFLNSFFSIPSVKNKTAHLSNKIIIFLLDNASENLLLNVELSFFSYPCLFGKLKRLFVLIRLNIDTMTNMLPLLYLTAKLTSPWKVYSLSFYGLLFPAVFSNKQWVERHQCIIVYRILISTWPKSKTKVL